ncbi:MAG TPA: PKD domain-containing protein, partial [Candidatus Saccharimonadales bacterium]|nr:PKD domain-containing protein [Candidatus Saccharimonadales bacterium]
TVNHAYTAAGAYRVILTVTGSTGGTSSDTTTATVSDTLQANAGGPYTGTVGKAVTFDGSHSVPPRDGSIVNYAWVFGDGGSSNGASPTATHTYTRAGTFTVLLTVTDNSGHASQASTTATIAAAPAVLPPLSVAAHTFLPTFNQLDSVKVNVAAGSKVTVRVYDLVGRLIRVLYDGDFVAGAAITWDGRDAQLQLAPAGTYVCHLEVRDFNGNIQRYAAPMVVARRLKRD